MSVQAWMIKSWSTRQWYLPLHTALTAQFEHVSTHIRGDDDVTGLRVGSTVWATPDHERPVGLAWEWVEVRPAVFMLADPNAILTNLQFVDDQGRQQDGLQKIITTNQLVHGLDWQQRVREAVNQALDPGPLVTLWRHTAWQEAA